MSKPSIFSKHYNKRIKRRKNFKIVTICAAAIVVGVGIVSFGQEGSLLETARAKIQSVFSQDNKDLQKAQNVDNINKEEAKNEESKEEAKKEVPKEISEILPLDLGNSIKAEVVITKNAEGKEIYSEVKPNSSIEWDFNKEKNSIVFLNKTTQDMFLLDSSKNLKNITKKEYVSTDKKTYSKEEQLKLNPKLTWHENPKFIDDSTIMYISRLPWLNTDHKYYVWLYDISGSSHKVMWSKELQGNTINLKSAEKGIIKVDVDGNNVSFSKDGKVD